MDLIHDLSSLRPATPVALTIGNFDGVHLGHQHVIRTVVERARRLPGLSAVMTFEPDTSRVLHPQREARRLTSIDERAALIAELGVDLLIVMPFDLALAQLTAEEFMALICRHLRLAVLLDGPDFRLGKGAQGTMPVLAEIGQRLGYEVEVIEAMLLDGQRVSSTQIRMLVEAGRVDEVPVLLGRRFSLQGPVVGGDQRGRTIGVPTANVALDPDHVLPSDGVYACYARLADGAALPAVVNIGVRPTFGVLGRTVEAHLLDFSADLYGQLLRLEFVERLRGEQRFSGVEALVQQIRLDIERGKEVLDRAERE